MLIIINMGVVCQKRHYRSSDAYLHLHYSEMHAAGRDFIQLVVENEILLVFLFIYLEN